MSPRALRAANLHQRLKGLPPVEPGRQPAPAGPASPAALAVECLQLWDTLASVGVRFIKSDTEVRPNATEVIMVPWENLDHPTMSRFQLWVVRCCRAAFGADHHQLLTTPARAALADCE